MKGKKHKQAKWPPSPPIPKDSLLVKDTAREMLTKEAPELESEEAPQPKLSSQKV